MTSGSTGNRPTKCCSPKWPLRPPPLKPRKQAAGVCSAGCFALSERPGRGRRMHPPDLRSRPVWRWRWARNRGPTRSRPEQALLPVRSRPILAENMPARSRGTASARWCESSPDNWCAAGSGDVPSREAGAAPPQALPRCRRATADSRAPGCHHAAPQLRVPASGPARRRRSRGCGMSRPA